jgi:hypothetical protein
VRVGRLGLVVVLEGPPGRRQACHDEINVEEEPSRRSHQRRPRRVKSKNLSGRNVEMQKPLLLSTRRSWP